MSLHLRWPLEHTFSPDFRKARGVLGQGCVALEEREPRRVETFQEVYASVLYPELLERLLVPLVPLGVRLQ